MSEIATPVCSVNECARQVHCRGYCSMHYFRARKHGEPGPAHRIKEVNVDQCLEASCEAESTRRFMCERHYSAWMRGALVGGVEPRRGQKCKVEPCDRVEASIGFCHAHYKRHRRGQSTEHAIGDPAARGVNWIKTGQGYLVRAAKNSDGRRTNVPQHREVMEEHLGRKLLPHENIHHINGVRDDNRIENLEIWNTSQPAGQRVEDKVAWARQLLALYGDADEVAKYA